MQANCPRMLRGRFWLENQDFGVSVGAIGIIFRDTSFPISPRSQNRLFRKIVPGVQGRRNGRGKNCLHFWGQIATKVAKHVAEPILAPESRFRGIRWGNLHHFSKSIRSDWSWGVKPPAQPQQFRNRGWGGLTPHAAPAISAI